MAAISQWVNTDQIFKCQDYLVYDTYGVSSVIKRIESSARFSIQRYCTRKNVQVYLIFKVINGMTSFTFDVQFIDTDNSYEACILIRDIYEDYYIKAGKRDLKINLFGLNS